MAQKLDPLRGLNPDQSGPKEKIQNGDPRSSPNRDQRSGAKEAGGPGPSLQADAPEGQPVPPHDNLVLSDTSVPPPEGVNMENQLPAGAYDNAGRDMKTGELTAPNRDQDRLQTGHTKVVSGTDVKKDKDGDVTSVDGQQVEEDDANAAPAGKLKIKGKADEDDKSKEKVTK